MTRRLVQRLQDVQRHLVVLTPDVRSSDPQLPTVSSSYRLPSFHLSCLRPGDHPHSRVSGWAASSRLGTFPCVSFTAAPRPPPPKLDGVGPRLIERQTFALVQLLPMCPERDPGAAFPTPCAAGSTCLPQELSAHLRRLIRQPGSGTSWLALASRSCWPPPSKTEDVFFPLLCVSFAQKAGCVSGPAFAPQPGGPGRATAKPAAVDSRGAPGLRPPTASWFRAGFWLSFLPSLVLTSIQVAILPGCQGEWCPCTKPSPGGGVAVAGKAPDTGEWGWPVEVRKPEGKQNGSFRAQTCAVRFRAQLTGQPGLASVLYCKRPGRLPA